MPHIKHTHHEECDGQTDRQNYREAQNEYVSTLSSAGSWYEWNSWSSCSLTCGAGSRSRYRKPCNRRVLGWCPNSYPTSEVQTCNQPACRRTCDLPFLRRHIMRCQIRVSSTIIFSKYANITLNALVRMDNNCRQINF